LWLSPALKACPRQKLETLSENKLKQKELGVWLKLSQSPSIKKKKKNIVALALVGLGMKDSRRNSYNYRYIIFPLYQF
jgi:hypothetical protein